MNADIEREQLNAGFEQAGYYFALLSEPTRLKILTVLCAGERAVGAVVSALDASQANVSRQLNTLYRSNILARRKEGTQVYYRIRDRHTIELCRGICRKAAMARSGAATCRLADNSCSIGGVDCRWQPRASKDGAQSSRV